MADRALAMGGLSTAVDVVDQSGKIITTTKTVFGAFKDAKAAYHARKAEIVNQRNQERAARDLEKAQREGAKLAALEKEARRAERHRKRLESDGKKKLIEGPSMSVASSSSGRKDETDKEREKRKKKEKEKSGQKALLSALVVFDSGDKKDKEKKKHKSSSSSHGSSSRDRDVKELKESSKDKEKDKKKGKGSSADASKQVAIIPLPTPPLDDDTSSDESVPPTAQDVALRNLHHNPSALVLAPVILNNVPGGPQAQQLLDMSHNFLNMFDLSDTDSPLTALLLKLTEILDTFDCLNASITTLVASLSRDPDALAMVGLTLAEIAAVVAKTAPGVIVAAKASFPIIFALLASPQFLVSAGASVIVFGGYQIVRRVTGFSGPPTAPTTPKAIKEDHEDHLAFGPGLEDYLSDTEVEPAPAPVKAAVAAAPVPAPVPAPAPVQKKAETQKKVEKQKALPPLPEGEVAAVPPKSPKRNHTSPAVSGGKGDKESRKEEKEKERPKLHRESSTRDAGKKRGMKGLLFRQQTM